MYQLVAKAHRAPSVVTVEGIRFGDGGFVVVAGPCAVESKDQLERTAKHVAAHGAAMLRAGAYKPRTSPYSFQGLGDEGVVLVSQACASHGLPGVVEAVAPEQTAIVARHVAMIQIGARNMQNFALLTAAAKTGKPVLLKRGPAATLEELLYAAEYIAVEGNTNIVLCERGIRGFDPQTRNCFDLAGALRLKELTHLPVIVDPSHATGRKTLVAPLVIAAAAAGLDGAIVEVHPEPAHALSDGPQALEFDDFTAMMNRLETVRPRTMPEVIA